MDFFDKLASKVTALVNDVAAGTEKVAHDAQYKIKISELKSDIKELYSKIGVLAYEQYEKTGKIELNGEILKDLECMKNTFEQISLNESALNAIKKSDQEEKEKKKVEREEKFNQIKDNVENKVDSVKTDIVTKVDDAKKDVEQKVQDVKNKLNN